MKTKHLVTEISVPYAEIRAMGNSKDATRELMRRLYQCADDEAIHAGGQVRITVQPQVVMKRTSSVVLGGDLMLIAAEWVIDVP